MRLIVFSMMLCGLILMIFVSENHLFMIFISIALTGMANMMLWASQLQIANLFRSLDSQKFSKFSLHKDSFRLINPLPESD